MNFRISAIVAVAAAVLAGAAVLRPHRPVSKAAVTATSPPSQAPEGATAPKSGLVVVSADQIAAQKITTVRPGSGMLDKHIVVPGTIIIDAARVARVPSRVVGTVSEMRKQLGEDVKANEVVAVLDSREVADAKSDYLGTRVQAELQRLNFNRQQKLLDIKAISAAQLDQTRATFQEAQLRVDLARQKLSALGLNAVEVAEAAKQDESTPTRSSLRRYELRSPIAGRVVERKLDVGAAVGKEGEPADVYTIADLSKLWVDIAVPTAEISSVKEGAHVHISVEGDEPRSAMAHVVFVSPLLNQDTRTARVIATLDNTGFAWRPGTFVSAEIAMQPRPARLLVPRGAVQTIDGQTKVFVRVPQGFAARDVRLGAADDDSYEVLAGLADGESVAVGNSFLLKADLGKAESDGD